MGAKETNSAAPPQGVKRTNSDIRAGELFADTYAERVRYVAEQDTFYIFDGKRWRPDTTEQIYELTKALVVRRMPKILATITDPVEYQAYENWMNKLHSNRARREMLFAARSSGSLAALLSDFDADPRFFNTRNGILDLETLNFLPHDAKDPRHDPRQSLLMLSKMAGVSYDPEARCERWEHFISEIMAGDRDTANFLQKAAGYALAGTPKEQCLFILYGASTRNGKGTFMHALGDVFGEYAATIRPETLALDRSRTGGSPNSDLARLDGVRLVDASEPGKGMLFDAALVKNLTGGDRILARFMYKEPFEFVPQFVIFISTNHLPRVDDVTLFTSGRVFCIPFPVHFEGKGKDANLGRLFGTEEAKSAILNWCIEGYVMYKAEGLRENIPQAVLDVTREYEESSDTLGRFLRECVKEVPGAWTQSSVLYGAYKDWMEQNGQVAMGAKSFSMALKDKGYTIRAREAGNGFDGLQLAIVSIGTYKPGP